jgi:hypothetical protein
LLIQKFSKQDWCNVIEITEGISNGTEVITDGKHRLADGSSVRVVVE